MCWGRRSNNTEEPIVFPGLGIGGARIESLISGLMFFLLKPQGFKTQRNERQVASHNRKERKGRNQTDNGHLQDAGHCTRCSRQMSNMPEPCELGLLILHHTEKGKEVTRIRSPGHKADKDLSRICSTLELLAFWYEVSPSLGDSGSPSVMVSS